MSILTIIYTLASLFYALMDFLPAGFQRAKAGFKAWFLKKCQTIITLDDLTLMTKLKPWMYGAGFGFMLLGSFVLNTWGPDDPDTAHLSFAGMGTLSVVILGLISFSKLKEVFKDLVRQGLKISIWIAIGLILISLAFSVLYAVANGQPISSVILSQEVLQVLIQILAVCLLANLIADVFLSTLLLAIPFYTGRLILWSIRKVANLVVRKGQKDSTKIPQIILTIFFAALALYSYLQDKALP